MAKSTGFKQKGPEIVGFGAFFKNFAALFFYAFNIFSGLGIDADEFAFIYK